MKPRKYTLVKPANFGCFPGSSSASDERRGLPRVDEKIAKDLAARAERSDVRHPIAGVQATSIRWSLCHGSSSLRAFVILSIRI
jgi:hypothetical protein